MQVIEENETDDADADPTSSAPLQTPPESSHDRSGAATSSLGDVEGSLASHSTTDTPNHTPPKAGAVHPIMQLPLPLKEGAHPLFAVEQLGVDRRLIVNRKRQLKMYRVWMQGKFRKL